MDGLPSVVAKFPKVLLSISAKTLGKLLISLLSFFEIWSHVFLPVLLLSVYEGFFNLIIQFEKTFEKN